MSELFIILFTPGNGISLHTFLYNMHYIAIILNFCDLKIYVFFKGLLGLSSIAQTQRESEPQRQWQLGQGGP